MAWGEGESPPAGAPWHLAHLLPAALAVGVGLTLLLVALRHGLDWTDESFVWVMDASDRVAVGEAWGFQHLLHPVWVAVGETVLAMRVLRVVGYVAVSLVLTWAAVRALRASGVVLRRRERWFVLLVAQGGTLLAFSYPPRYLGYNELSSWSSALLCGVVAVGLVPLPTDKGARRVLPWLAAGLLLPTLLVAKFTAGVGWLGLLAVLLIVRVPGTPRWLRLASVLGVATGVSAVLLATGVPVAAVIRSATALLTDRSAQEESSHSVAEILRTYTDSTVITGQAVALPVLLLLALALLCVRAPRPSVGTSSPVVLSVVTAVLGVLLAVGAAALLWRAPVVGSWDTLGTVAAVLGLGGAGASAVALPAVLRSRPPGEGRPTNRPAPDPRAPTARLILVLGLTLVTPLVASVGTNNPIWGHALFSATPWATLCGVGLCLLARTAPGALRAAPLLAGGLLVAVTTAGVVLETVVHPYRSTNYLHQNSPTVSPTLAGLRLTPDQAATADWLHAVALEEDAAGIPAVAIASPGHLLALNRSGWASPWRGGSWQASIEAACADGPPPDLFVVEPRHPADAVARERARLQTALVACGLTFPGDFRSVAAQDGATVWRLDQGRSP